MRIDRLTRLKIGKIPQGLIEKYLRFGKIKINKKKIKSSTKVKTNDIVSFFNLDFKETIDQKKIKFEPSQEIIKSNENQIIDNNENFIVRKFARTMILVDISYNCKKTKKTAAAAYIDRSEISCT